MIDWLVSYGPRQGESSTRQLQCTTTTMISWRAFSDVIPKPPQWNSHLNIPVDRSSIESRIAKESQSHKIQPTYTTAPKSASSRTENYQTLSRRRKHSRTPKKLGWKKLKRRKLSDSTLSISLPLGGDNGWTLSASGSRSPSRALLTIWSSSKNRGGRNWWSEMLQFCMHGVGGFK